MHLRQSPNHALPFPGQDHQPKPMSLCRQWFGCKHAPIVLPHPATSAVVLSLRFLPSKLLPTPKDSLSRRPNLSFTVISPCQLRNVGKRTAEIPYAYGLMRQCNQAVIRIRSTIRDSCLFAFLYCLDDAWPRLGKPPIDCGFPSNLLNPKVHRSRSICTDLDYTLKVSQVSRSQSQGLLRKFSLIQVVEFGRGRVVVLDIENLPFRNG